MSYDPDPELSISKRRSREQARLQREIRRKRHLADTRRRKNRIERRRRKLGH